MIILESKGEQRVREILERERFHFIQEYSFPDLRSYKGKPLRFDFAVFNDDSVVAACIEVSGRQHFEYVPHFSKNKILWQYARERDLQKAQYCLVHKIPLYSIPYCDIELLNSSEDIFRSLYCVKRKWNIYNLYQE